MIGPKRAPEDGDDGAEQRLRDVCASANFDLDQAGDTLIERMRLLAERSDTFDDAMRMSGYAERIFSHYDATTSQPFSALERQTVILGCVFSDIGKSGPLGAAADARRVIVETFAIENVEDDTQSVETLLRTHDPADAGDRIAQLRAAGVDPSMPVRQFWNLHSAWTLDVVEAAGLPPEAVAAAATHHFLDGINPGHLVGDDDRFTRRFGRNAAFDRAEKLVILLDKYDAARRRGGRSHGQAIAWLRERIARSPRFCDDAELIELLGAVAAVLAASEAVADT